MSKINIGMISFAHAHAFTFLRELANMPDVRIAGVFDERQDRVEPILQQYGVPYFHRHDRLLAAGVDAVVICSENARHARFALDAAAAGKHILCEKPLATSREDMRAMIEACRSAGVRLMTAFPCRYLPAVLEAKAAVDRGDIGDVIAIKGTNRGRKPGGWFIDRALSGGGAILDHTVHMMDLMNWFMRSAPVEVYAEADTLLHEGLEVEDVGMIHVTYPNGTIGVLDPSWSRLPCYPGGADVTMHIIGSDGAIRVDAFAQHNELYRNDRSAPAWTYWGVAMERLMLRDFVSAVRDGRDAPISGEDGFRSAAVALAAYDSARTGRPVSLDWA